MRAWKLVLAALSLTLICGLVQANEAALLQRIADLEKRVSSLEQALEEVSSKDRWKDPVIWQRIKKEMFSDDIRKLLGKPVRVEKQIFTTWYYHPTSKLHSYVWFDEGTVLGWKAPD